MKKSRAAASLLLLLCLLPLVLGLNLQEDDLVFDDVGDEASTLEPERSPELHRTTSKPAAGKKWQRVEKLLGMPDAVANAGHVFKLHVPKQAFAGNVDYYEARGSNGRGLPHWLRWDEPASALYGVPSRKDVGRHRVSVKAFGKHGDVAQDSFIIHVVPEKREHYAHKDGKKRCNEDQDRTMLTILIDARYENLKPSAKVRALENLAGFLGLHPSSISIQPEVKENSGSSMSVVLSGPGNVGRRREKHSTLVQWQVGCDGHFWPHQIDTIKQIPEQARDGTLSEVMELPVYQWRVRADSTDFARNRRDATAGSGDGLLPDEEYEDEDEDPDYDDDDYDNSEGITESPHEPKYKTVHSSNGAGDNEEESKFKPVNLPSGAGDNDEHPHRHRHGYGNVANIGPSINTEDEEEYGGILWRNPEINNSLFNSTSSTTTTTASTTTETEPSSTTSTTTTTTTTTTEAPTTSTSAAPELSTISTTSTTTEQELEPSSSTTENTTTTTTTTTTTQVTSSTVETLTSETTTTSTTITPLYTNLTQVATGSSSSQTNVTTDSLTVDNEEPLTTDHDIDNETESDEMTTLQPILFIGSESTTAGSSGAPALNGSVVDVLGTTSEPNTTSIFSVNATSEEYPEASVPAKESSSPSSATSFSTASWNDTDDDDFKAFIDPEDFGTMHVPVYSSTPSTTTSTTTEAPTTSPTPEPTTPSTTTTTTTTETPTTLSTTSTTTTTTTTPAPTTPTTQSSTTTTTTTERNEYMRNLPPKVEKRLKKIAITQGKPLSYLIPEDAFSDPEDGNTRKLRLRIYEKDAPLKSTYWLQFNEITQEIYGLPLEEQYGTYPFEIIAVDREGLTASDRLDISVQQHKQIRAVNHEFHVYLKIEKRSEFPTNVDWELKVMRSLAELYGDEDLSYITVRSIDIDHDQAIYTWTNDSLARSSTCPQDEINRLYRVLVADEKTEEPSVGLIRVLGPEIRPKRVVYQGLEQCQQIKETQVNKFPVPRNQIDQLNATVGQLFVYKVPKDTFFDEEDGDTGSMKASLLTANRTEIPPWDWLQFDSSNQEFYGVPLKQDIGRKTYQLVVKDREGLEATDSLVAEVHPAPITRHVVEISMTLNMPYDTFANSAQKRREFIQKLQRLYGDKDASAISLLYISGNRDTTTVTWRNVTLPTKECPHEEIKRLRNVLVNDNLVKSFSDQLDREFNRNSQQPEFAVIQLTVSQMGVCHETGIGEPDLPPIDDSTSVGASQDEYFFTIILPTIIIAALILLAAIIACILYKRKRSGKMSVSEKDDERQSFRSKGIPVIFQDELDEKPDPGNKSPIILKEEKPPLPPPEYQRAEDGADIPMLSKENSEEPYQPPPPFATNRDSNRQNRPKPTPTYRKPPPYVPP